MSQFKLSYYNFIHKFSSKQMLIWNTFTGSVFFVDPNEATEFEKQSGAWFEGNKHYFIDGGVLVKAEEQQNQIDFIMNKRREFVEQTKTISFTILPTTACNARCLYCFELNNQIMTMSNECIKTVVAFIEKQSKDFEQISITWFGGEPLLFPNIISAIMTELSIVCASKKISCSMISNGVLFDAETVQKAKMDWHVDYVQITLDGTQYNYERIKNYINIQGAFSIVLNNIQSLVDGGVDVSIRLNVDKENWKDLIDLIDELHIRFDNKIHVYAYPIFETRENDKNLIGKRELAFYLGKIFEKLKKAGYRTQICEFKEFVPWYCASTLPYNFVIMPNGKLLKCQSEIGQEQYLGDVGRGMIDYERNLAFSRVELDNDCIKCCYLPICQGGCLASSKCISKIERCCLEKYYLHELLDEYFLKENEELLNL